MRCKRVLFNSRTGFAPSAGESSVSAVDAGPASPGPSGLHPTAAYKATHSRQYQPPVSLADVQVITPPFTSPEHSSMTESRSTTPNQDENFYSAESSDEDDLRWKDLREEHAKMRKSAKEKQLLLARSFGSYTDSSPAILESSASLPNAIAKLSPLSRTTVRAYISDLKERERVAINAARIYRSCTEELKRKCMEVHCSALKEREGVRYFWRQQILEGSTRSGCIVRAAIKDCRSRM